MGTRGLRVYRVNGIYYTIFVYCDASPSGVGKEVVDEIPADPEAYKGTVH